MQTAALDVRHHDALNLAIDRAMGVQSAAARRRFHLPHGLAYDDERHEADEAGRMAARTITRAHAILTGEYAADGATADELVQEVQSDLDQARLHLRRIGS